MDEEIIETSLLDTKIDDMTVGDSLKLQVYILAGMAGIVGTVAAVGAAREKFRIWRAVRRIEKLETETTVPEETE